MRVQLSSMPDPKALSSVSYSNMRGGLNLSDDPVRVGSTQSPDMLNMWYRDGVLKKRSGQKRVIEGSAVGRASGQVWFYDKLFNGLIVYLDGTAIKYYDPSAEPVSVKTVTGTKIAAGTKHGCFFAFDERLYYKAEGVYLRLSYTSGVLTAENLLWKSGSTYAYGEAVYTPIISINRNADGTGGSSYQPENRINPCKTVWFDIDDSSMSYYLPVSGCSVERVQVGDDAVDTSGGAWPYIVGGREVTIHNDKVAEDSAENTYLRFSVPLYIDETEDGTWKDTSWLSSTSKGWHYLNNVVYSSFDWKVNDGTVINPTETILTGAGVSLTDSYGMPARLSMDVLNRAYRLCPITDENYFLVLDNGIFMSILIFRADSDFDISPCAKVVSYDAKTTQIQFRDYYFVRYEYATQELVQTDYRGKEGSPWHYMKHFAFSSIDLDVAADITYKSGANTSNVNQFFGESPTTIAYKHMGTKAKELLFVEETDAEWRYVYSSTTTPAWEFDASLTDRSAGVIDDLRVMKYYTTSNRKKIRLKSVVVVKIPKTDPISGTKTPTAATTYTATVEDIVWSACDIVWTHYIPGDVLKSASGTAIPSEYEKIARIAMYRARRDYPNAAITGEFAIAATPDGPWDNINVFIDAGISLDHYDKNSSEFKASGFIVQSFTPKEKRDTDVNLDLTTPAVKSNKLRVTYRKENSDAFRAIADCEYATSFGGSDAVAVVLGGCNAQPNAIFWSGNGSNGIDPTYFPMDQYNLCGTYQDPVTGFGKQQSSLIVFQTRHTSRASYGIETIGERKYIDLKLSTINSERGCDMPWSIALCGNNLVWMHSKYGVMYLKATTSAYENMIVVISENINGNSARPGLLKKLKDANQYTCIGIEDGQRYYAFVAGDLYVWDFTIYSVSDGISLLSWSKHQTFTAQAATEADTGKLWFADGNGTISILDEDTDTDFGEAIPCRYTTPLESFNGYYRLRNVTKLVLGIRSRHGGTLTVAYGGEGQSGQQKIQIPKSDMYTPIVLKPRGLRLHHFQMAISGDGEDGGVELMDIVTFYTTAGVTR